MATEPRLPSDQRSAELAHLYARAQRTIISQVQAAIRAGQLERAAERRLQLAAVLATLDQLGAETDPLAREVARQAYQDGSDTVVRELQRVTAGPVQVPASFTGVSVEAVAAIEDSVIGRLRTARQIVGRTVDDVYAAAGRRATVRALLGASGSVRSARADMMRDLMRDRDVQRLLKDSRGLTGFVDRAGKRWALDTYAEMAVRTTTRQAVVQGSMVRMASHGIDLARVSSHASACTICAPYEGRLVSLSGQTVDYQGEAVMDASIVPPYHPNCRHSLAPFVTEVEEFRRRMQSAPAGII